MATSQKEKLEIILGKFNNQLSLQEIMDLYFETKGIIFGEQEIGETESLISINIFLEGYSLVYKYCSDKEIKDFISEELDLLLTLCDEASLVFDYLAENFPSFFGNNNKDRQDELRGLKENILQEKARRGENENEKEKPPLSNNPSVDKNLKELVNNLQTQLDTLKNSNQNGNNDSEIRNLQRRINLLEEERKRFAKTPVVQQPKDNNLLIGGLVFLSVFSGVIIVYLMFKNNSKKGK